MIRRRVSLARYAWLSILAALVTIGLKGWAYWLTGSVGLLSDAMESLVNLAAAVVALMMLGVSAQPPDRRHHFGHGKAEYFSSAFEGVLILVAAAGIGIAAWDRLRDPQPLRALDWGLAISAVAAAVNAAAAWVLLRVGHRARSIVLEADARHLLTDVWTSVGVIGGVAMAGFAGLQILDPLIALIVAANIVWTGAGLLRRSFEGFLDTSFPARDRALIEDVLDRYRRRGIELHDVRTRCSGVDRFMNVHLLVPGEWSVKAGHDLVEEFEGELGRALPNLHVTTHLEPLEDPRSFHHPRVEAFETQGRGGHRTRSSETVVPRGGESRRLVRLLLTLAAWPMLLAGTAASMLAAGWPADVGLACALLGFVAVLIVLRTGSRRDRRGEGSRDLLR